MPRPHRLSRWIASLVVLSCLFAPAAAAGEWIKYESAYLTVYSDCPPHRVKSLIRQYAALQQATRSLLVPAGTIFPHTTLVCFDRIEEFEKFSKSKEAGAYKIFTLYFAGQVGRNRMIATTADRNLDERIQSIYRSESRYAVEWYDADVPGWLRQALSSALAGIELKGSSISFGGPSSDFRSELKRKTWREWPTLVADAEEEYDENEKPNNLAPAQLWLLGDWMLFGPQPPGSSYFAMLAALRKDHLSRWDAFQDGIGMNGNELTERLRAHMKKPARPRAIPFDPEALMSDFRISPASFQETQVQFFYLKTILRSWHEAREHLDAAVAAGGDALSLRHAKALHAALNNDPATAVRLHREAISAGSKDAWTYLASARARLVHDSYDLNEDSRSVSVRTHSLSANQQEARTALAEIQTALELDPFQHRAYSLLGQAIWELPVVTREDADLLTPQVADDKLGRNLRYIRGMTYWRAGAKDEANADFEYITTKHPGSREARAIENWRRSLAAGKNKADAKAEIDQLIAEKRYSEAHQALEKLAYNESNLSHKRAYEREARKIRETADWMELLELSREERWRETEQAALTFLDNYLGSHRRPGVRSILEKARRYLD